MSTENDVKIDYAVVLKQLQGELDGLDERRQALLASISAIRRLVQNDQGDDEQLFVPRPVPGETVRMPAIPPRVFADKTPTEAYRLLMERWPGHYRAPQIADLFGEGGMMINDRTALLQAIHSVLKRERSRQLRSVVGDGGGNRY